MIAIIVTHVVMGSGSYIGKIQIVHFYIRIGVFFLTNQNETYIKRQKMLHSAQCVPRKSNIRIGVIT